MIKVIHVISDKGIGGAGWWLLNLLKYTDKSRLQLKVIVPRGSMLVQEIGTLGFETIQIDGMADKSLDMGTISVLGKIFRSEKPQVVHTHAALSARIAARLAGVKVIVHTKHCIDAPRKGVKKVVNSVINSCLSDKVIAVSYAVRKCLIASGIKAKSIETIYGGIEGLKEIGEEDKQKVREELGIAGNDVVVGCVARMVELKGHRYLLEAGKLLSGRYENIKLLLVGSGPSENMLKNYSEELGIKDKVIFTGFRSDVGNMVNIMDMVVLPSLTEAQSLALVEGLSLAKPCVGTDVGGIPEVVIEGENGLLVPPRNPERLAEAIAKLVESKELRKQMGQKGKEYADTKFTARSMADKIEKLYVECLKGGR